MKRTLVGILAGNGQNSRLYSNDFTTFQNNSIQDMAAWYVKDKHPAWSLDPSVGILIDDGKRDLDASGQPDMTRGIVPTLRNRMIKYAMEKGYEVLWIVDDDIRNFYEYDTNYTDPKQPLVFKKRTPLPEIIDETYGGIIGANFKRFKLAKGQKYSNQTPFSCVYLNLKRIKEKLNMVPQFWEADLIWDDFDYALQMRKLGILPLTFNKYAIIKNGTQDSETKGKSLAAAGVDKANSLGFFLYKRHGDDNTLIKLKVNIIDVHPSLKKVYQPRFWKYPVDSYENWKAAVLSDTNSFRKSEKAKKLGIYKFGAV